MILSLSGFLFEDDYRSQSLDLPRFCALARSAGYDGVELRRTQVTPEATADERRQVRGAIAGQGLRVTCLTARGMPATGPPRDEYLQRYLDLCRDLGCPLLKIGGDAAWMRQAVEMAARAGVSLASNNHVGGPLETVAGTLAYLDEVGDRRFGLLYDALHLSLGDEPYLGAIPALWESVHSILVHSLRPAEKGEQPHLERPHPELGSTSWVRALPDHPRAQDWGGVLGCFRSLGYDGFVTVIESGWPGAEREGVARHAAAVLRRLWEEADTEGERADHV